MFFAADSVDSFADDLSLWVGHFDAVGLALSHRISTGVIAMRGCGFCGRGFRVGVLVDAPRVTGLLKALQDRFYRLRLEP